VNICDRVSFPTGEGTLVTRDEDVNGVVIVRSESGEYRRVHMSQVKPLPLTPAPQIGGQQCNCANSYKYKHECVVCGEAWKPPIGEAPVHLTWDGEGFPPVGTQCLFYGVAVGWDERLTDGCEISILSEINRNNMRIGRVFTTTIDQEFILDYSCVEGTFKPIPTAHDIAVNELVDLMKNADLTSDQVDGSYVICAELLVDAGYRKHTSLNRDFSTGDTYNTDVNHWKAGVNVPGHMNAIEVYAGTKEGAELLRDEVLERLS
tara:strand:+ start:60 stop:845 length:786 start_codon:yes stop_codon:yes gene_type:complete